ncbi:hypothetical protein AALA78_03095 [Lachnospiraceae bacterium 42-17]|jgi:hypothetical protein|nr:hypothetical protein [Dorea sp.]
MSDIVRIVIDIEIDDESLYEKNREGAHITHDVQKGIILQDSDSIDGFVITTNLTGFNPVYDFFLCNGRIRSKELIS